MLYLLAKDVHISMCIFALVYLIAYTALTLVLKGWFSVIFVQVVLEWSTNVLGLPACRYLVG